MPYKFVYFDENGVYLWMAHNILIGLNLPPMDWNNYSVTQALFGTNAPVAVPSFACIKVYGLYSFVGP
jgi:hypothetical protein